MDQTSAVPTPTAVRRGGRSKGPSTADLLSPVKIKHGSYPKGVHRDGRGLYLRVSDTGAQSFVFRYMLDGRAREMGMGPACDVSLKEAREKAKALRDTLRRGIDPLDEKLANKAAAREAREAARLANERAEAAAAAQDRSRFARVAGEWVKRKAGTWKNAIDAIRWQRRLDNYVLPKIGHLPVGEIGPGHVLEIVEGLIAENKRETANRVCSLIKQILEDAALDGLYSGENAVTRARHRLAPMFKAAAKTARASRQPALPYRQVPDFMAALRQQPGMGARALEFAILTASRSGEVRHLEWSDVDFEAGRIVVPAERMKAGEKNGAHFIFLTPELVALLRAQETARTGKLVFPGMEDAPLSDVTLLAVIRRMNGKAPRWVDPKADDRPVVPHGFRSTFSTWANDLNIARHEVIEATLAHRNENAVAAAYNRADFEAERRELLAAWGRFCAGQRAPGAEVIPFAAKGSKAEPRAEVAA